jgi:hypothetical protein
MIKELVEAGYIVRERVKRPGGKFTWQTVILDVSLHDPRSQDLIVDPAPPRKRSRGE